MSGSKSFNPVLFLRQRELSGSQAPQHCGLAVQPAEALRDWAESDLLRHCTSTYCNTHPPPRSTIATAFSPDGKRLASSHGDHTVKITCWRTGACLKVLDGHSRTPWVVRFHPTNPCLLASGSLDNYVRIWDLETGKCLYDHNFGKPIASLAFHAEGNELAVASGHRMYIWRYNQEGLTKPVPVVVLKTRRSLRAVHFHPQGAPLLLSAEVSVGLAGRKAALPLECTGLESRRERRARAEQRAATSETIAALEVRLRQRWLDREGPQTPPSATAATNIWQDTRPAQSEQRMWGSRAAQTASSTNRHCTSVAMDCATRPGISLSVSGPPGGLPLRASQSGPLLGSAGPRREGAAYTHPRPPHLEVPSRPVLSLSMPGPEADSLYPLARRSMPARPTAQPMNITHQRQDGTRSEAEAAAEAELRHGASEQEHEEMRRFHAMLRAGGINPAVLHGTFPPTVPRHFYTEADHAPPIPSIDRLRSAEVSIPGTARANPTSISSFSASSARPQTGAAPSSSGSASAPGLLSAMPEWESWNVERSASRRGQGWSGGSCLARSSDGCAAAEPMATIAEEAQCRRRPLLNFLRRASMPAPAEPRQLLSSLFRSADGYARTPSEPLQPEPPRTVLQRISGSGGNANESESSHAWLPDLPQVIDGHWSGARPRTQRQETQQRQPTEAAASSAALPPSLVNMGWEFPASNIIPERPPGRAPSRGHLSGDGEASQQAQLRSQGIVADDQRAVANVVGTEQPSGVLVRIWKYKHSQPAELGPLQLAIHNTVLCSEMGVHFSPCGRMVAACAGVESDSGSNIAADDGEGLPQYELRIYSLESSNFGQVLRSRAIKAAHCLTSIQFSPCSQHIMLAYGRRHLSLLRSLVADNRSSIIPVHTVLEVYRVSDMSVVRVLPSADDEVNSAAFHPFEGSGIAYGTKEGRVRILTHSSYPLASGPGRSGSNHWTRLEDELLAAAAEEGPDSSDDE